jgi:hypothetical protein
MLERIRRGAAATAMLVAFLAVGLMIGTAPVEAFTVSQIGTSGGNPGGLPIFQVSGLVEGDSFPVTYSILSGAVTASATITIFDLTTTQALIDISLTNTSPIISGGDPRITAFGLGIDPNANLALATVTDIGGGGDVDALTTFSASNFPGFQGVEFCATSGNNCGGGGSGGIDATNPDSTDQFRFTLPFLVPNTSGQINLSQFAVKIQGGPQGQSFEVPGGGFGGSGGSGGNGGSGGPGQVPGPASLLLIGTGLLGVALANWKRSGRSV